MRKEWGVYNQRRLWSSSTRWRWRFGGFDTGRCWWHNSNFGGTTYSRRTQDEELKMELFVCDLDSNRQSLRWRWKKWLRHQQSYLHRDNDDEAARSLLVRCGFYGIQSNCRLKVRTPNALGDRQLWGFIKYYSFDWRIFKSTQTRISCQGFQKRRLGFNCGSRKTTGPSW